VFQLVDQVDNGEALDVTRPCGATMPFDERAAGIYAPRHLGDFSGDQSPRSRRAAADRNVRFALGQVEHALFHQQLDVHPRMPRVKNVEQA
jgi:hypothetical protein